MSKSITNRLPGPNVLKSKLFSRTTIVAACALAAVLPVTASAHHILSGINMNGCELVLVHSETDMIAKVKLPGLYGWQPAACQHTAIADDEKTVYIMTDAVPPYNASIVTLRIKDIDWASGTIDARVEQTIQLDPAGTRSNMPVILQTNPAQPIMPWTRPSYTQTHGPTFLPHSKYFYVTHYTDNRVRGFKTHANGTLDPRVVYASGDLTRQTHGVNFNDTGKVGLGVGYDYDMGDVRVYKPNRHTGQVEVTGKIRLGTQTAYGAIAHYAVWLDDRYAYVGTMQVAATSATPAGSTIIEPSIWLLDVVSMKATRVIGTATSAVQGLLRSPSDVALAHGKLYVAEEDSWGERVDAPPGDYGRDGYVSIWDVSVPAQPRFIKRLAPGDGLPSDFRNAHTASAMADDSAVYVSSFISDHLIKIDTETDTVTKVYSMEDGLSMFHGEFAAGRNR